MPRPAYAYSRPETGTAEKKHVLILYIRLFKFDHRNEELADSDMRCHARRRAGRMI
jgi:hypothetical protein